MSVTFLTVKATQRWVGRPAALLFSIIWMLGIYVQVPTLVHKHYRAQGVSPAHSAAACEEPRVHTSLSPTELEVLGSIL